MAMSESMLRQLRRLAVERRPEACLGCGFEYSCSIHGCRVVKAAVEELTPDTCSEAGVGEEMEPDEVLLRWALLR